MNKIKYLPLALFLATTIKGLIINFTLVDAPILLILGSIAAFYEFKSQDGKINDLNNKCNSIEQQLNELKKSNEDVRSYFSGMKLGQQMRSNTNVK